MSGLRAHQRTDVPFNQDGPDRLCQGAGCGARAIFFSAPRRDHLTGMPIIEQRFCGGCVPAIWLPVRKARAEAA